MQARWQGVGVAWELAWSKSETAPTTFLLQAYNQLKLTNGDGSFLATVFQRLEDHSV